MACVWVCVFCFGFVGYLLACLLCCWLASECAFPSCVLARIACILPACSCFCFWVLFVVLIGVFFVLFMFLFCFCHWFCFCDWFCFVFVFRRNQSWRCWSNLVALRFSGRSIGQRWAGIIFYSCLNFLKSSIGCRLKSRSVQQSLRTTFHSVRECKHRLLFILVYKRPEYFRPAFTRENRRGL